MGEWIRATIPIGSCICRTPYGDSQNVVGFDLGPNSMFHLRRDGQ